METVHIDTSQNVVLQYDVATIVDRGLAVLVDWLVLGGYTIALILLFDLIGTEPPEWVAVVLFGFPWFLYHLICEITMNGQSIGKRSLRIKVARLDGGQPGIGHYLMRWVLRPIDSFLMLGTIVILFNGKGQRLGDIAAGTTVISLKQRTRLSDTLLMDVPDEYQVTFPEVAHLTDANMRIVRQVVANNSEARTVLQFKLAVKIREELKLTTELQPEPFLRVLLKDYVFLTGR